MKDTTAYSDADVSFMRRAILLGQKRLGKTSPNPAVGCVLVKDGIVIAEAATGEGGRPHAEELALELAGDKAQGATAYVTLEPCHTRSNGGPGCSDRLIAARVSRVVSACADPHPTATDGFAKLKAAGIEVEVGCCAEEAQDLTAGFFMVMDHNRPLVGASQNDEAYDADFFLDRGESFEAALERMANEGLTRVRVRPNSPLAMALKAKGLLDLEE